MEGIGVRAACGGVVGSWRTCAHQTCEQTKVARERPMIMRQAIQPAASCTNIMPKMAGVVIHSRNVTPRRGPRMSQMILRPGSRIQVRLARVGEAAGAEQKPAKGLARSIDTASGCGLGAGYAAHPVMKRATMLAATARMLPVPISVFDRLREVFFFMYTINGAAAAWDVVISD